MYEFGAIIFMAVLFVILIGHAVVRICKLLKQYATCVPIDDFDDSNIVLDGRLFNTGSHPAGIFADVLLYTGSILILSLVWPATAIVGIIWGIAYTIRRKNLRVKRVLAKLKDEPLDEVDDHLAELEEKWAAVHAASGIQKMPVIRQRRMSRK
jgi:hypothetical protein